MSITSTYSGNHVNPRVEISSRIDVHVKTGQNWCVHIVCTLCAHCVHIKIRAPPGVCHQKPNSNLCKLAKNDDFQKVVKIIKTLKIMFEFQKQRFALFLI